MGIDPEIPERVALRMISAPSLVWWEGKLTLDRKRLVSAACSSFSLLVGDDGPCHRVLRNWGRTSFCYIMHNVPRLP
jgi:hypothetical protein